MRKVWVLFLAITMYSMIFAANRYEFVKEFEQFRPRAYWDVNRYSIGYGTKAQGKNQVITKEEATKAFNKEMDGIEKKVQSRLNRYGIKYNDEMLRAMVSFEYNLGYQKKQWNRLKEGKVESYAYNMTSYNKAKGKTLGGLTKRRKVERDLFLNGYNKINNS